MLQDKSYVDGKWVEAKTGNRFDIVDPGTGKTWATAPNNAAEDVDAAVQSSHQAFLKFGKLNPRVRAQLLLKWHELIVENRDDIAKIVVHETGKPLAEAYGEIDYATGE